MNVCTWLTMILMTFFMAACGGGGGGSDSASTGTSVDTTATSDTATGITTGIAVDPYIVGAEFEEIAADGHTIQQSIEIVGNRSVRFRARDCRRIDDSDS